MTNSIEVVPAVMTAVRYQNQVLDTPLHDFYQEMCEEWGVVFQEDGASCHRAKSTKKWLAQNSVESFPHPSKSPVCMLYGKEQTLL
jgi:hypothetical protein